MVVFFLNGDTGCIEEMRRNVFELWLSFFSMATLDASSRENKRYLKEIEGKASLSRINHVSTCFHSFSYLSIDQSSIHMIEEERSTCEIKKIYIWKLVTAKSMHRSGRMTTSINRRSVLF